MKNLLILLLLTTSSVLAQQKATQTRQFKIAGKVKNESVITLDSLSKYAIKNIGNIKVTDHTGASKHEDDQLKGVLLKDILNHSQWLLEPHLFSSMYFTCVGSDGYKVVYSWNELFNTDIGDSVYIVTKKNGITAENLPASIQMVSMLDHKTGRRYLHNLDKIVVNIAE